MTIGTFDNPFISVERPGAISHCHKCGTAIYKSDRCFMHNALILCKVCGNEKFDIPVTGEELEIIYEEMFGG